ncbi:hypothetical protein [Mycoplasma todarodis]|uniref:Uncharacterized protein n=1 Tax=Mycoplasma todarodis TaxID=1937191 RepID=A0A4R0XT39_9MOLU|nr:hypothetical protein [Mycoplasma todarodis]TCG12063.1 hypothetical protein C4B25_00010 [Mycoplasma todarodis]
MKIKKISAIVLSLITFIVINLFIFNFKNIPSADIKNSQISTSLRMQEQSSVQTKEQTVTFEPSDFFEFGFNKTEQQYFYVKKEIMDKFEVVVLYDSKKQTFVNDSSEYGLKLTNLKDGKNISVKVKPRDGYTWASEENVPKDKTQFKTYSYTVNWGIDNSLMESKGFLSQSISTVWIFAISLIAIVVALTIMLGFIILK